MKSDEKQVVAENDVGHEPSGLRIDLRSGVLVRHADGVFRISAVRDICSVVATAVETGRTQVLLVVELTALESAPPVASVVDVDSIAEDDRRVAQTRYEAIRPLLEGGQSRSAVERRASEVHVNPATLYRWLSRYRSMGAISALIPSKRGWKRGNYRISDASEVVIRDVIQKFCLKPERPNAQKVVREVQRICESMRIKPPSATAIRARVARIPEVLDQPKGS